MLRRRLLPFATLASLLIANPAWAKAKSLELRFDVHVRESVVAKGRMLVGPRSAGRKSVRAVTIEGHSEDLAGVLYAGSSQATSWLDAEWKPVAARWSSEFLRRKSQTQATYEGKHITADFARAGKGGVHVDRELDERAHDLVSLVPWLVQQKVKAGQQLDGTIYVGADVCHVHLTVAAVESVTVPAGTRPGLPIAVTVEQCRVKRAFTLWLDGKDWTPLKIRVAETVVGAVELVLTGVSQVDVAAPTLPSHAQVSSGTTEMR
jgi:hypothetical protein